MGLLAECLIVCLNRVQLKEDDKELELMWIKCDRFGWTLKFAYVFVNTK